MRRFGGAVLAVTVTGALALAALPGTAATQGHERPDLKMSNGSVSSAGGELTGSFVVKNKGNVRARKSSATLVVQASGGDVQAGVFPVRKLKRGKSQTVQVAVAVPSGLPIGSWPMRACADGADKLRERSEADNCRTVGSVEIDDVTPPPSSVPTDPVPFAENSVFTLNSPQSNYWVYVPSSYDETHQTPTTLFVWLHGCGGQSSGDIYQVSPGGVSQDWISVAVGGEEGNCWNVNSDQSRVLAAIADIKTHFNINPRSVILGGYSSGGDLAYRTAFYNAGTFAGVLVENTSPFRDTGSSQAASLAAASWKFHVVHLAHIQDTTYPIAGVKNETDAMTAAGFPLSRVERDGDHYNAPGDIVNGHAVPGTTADIATYLLSHIDDGWLSPP